MDDQATFTYAQAEAALARVFGIKAEGRGALRGRLKHYQTLGISPASPGKGKRIEYTFEDVFRWTLCLQYAQFGIDPKIIAEIDQYNWLVMQEGISIHKLKHNYVFMFTSLVSNVSEPPIFDKVNGVKAVNEALDTAYRRVYLQEVRDFDSAKKLFEEEFKPESRPGSMRHCAIISLVDLWSALKVALAAD